MKKTVFLSLVGTLVPFLLLVANLFGGAILSDNGPLRGVLLVGSVIAYMAVLVLGHSSPKGWSPWLAWGLPGFVVSLLLANTAVSWHAASLGMTSGSSNGVALFGTLAACGIWGIIFGAWVRHLKMPQWRQESQEAILWEQPLQEETR